MRSFWKVLAVLALVLPLGAFVAGNLVASAADDPAPRRTILIDHQSAEPSDDASTSSPGEPETDDPTPAALVPSSPATEASDDASEDAAGHDAGDDQGGDRSDDRSDDQGDDHGDDHGEHGDDDLAEVTPSPDDWNDDHGDHHEHGDDDGSRDHGDDGHDGGHDGGGHDD